MPWEKKYDENEVLERAMNAFWARGYEATSMSDLVEATGINRGSIYAAYTNKHALFMQALRHFDKVHRVSFFDEIAQRHTPKDAIVAAFEGAARNTGQGDTPAGCLLVNSVLELSPHDAEVRDLIDDSLREVEGFFFSMIEAAKREGTVEKSLASRTTAQALLGLFLGLRVLTRSKPRRPVIDAITSQARMMLG
ncbi:MAG: TetR family transcriptional regulator [Alphaproteobacteria bacterium]|nr:TetR family transcriptional regulator [Alphaproteobacteria bacterium]